MQIRQVYIVCPGEEGYSQFLTKKAHFLLRENKTTRVHVISWINLVSLPVSKTLLRSGIEPRSPTGSRRITKKQWISACKDWYTCNYINEKCYDYITIKHVKKKLHRAIIYLFRFILKLGWNWRKLKMQAKLMSAIMTLSE